LSIGASVPTPTTTDTAAISAPTAKRSRRRMLRLLRHRLGRRDSLTNALVIPNHTTSARHQCGRRKAGPRRYLDPALAR
jgi:hypothetical protein